MSARAKNCTIRDLAGYVGLSTCTVSKVLNDPDNLLPIPEATRNRVREVARELNYVPNVNAQRFFTRRSNVIGLLVPPQEGMGYGVFRDHHFADILSGVERALKGTHYNLLLLFNREEYCASGRYEALFRSKLIDGLLIWGIHAGDSYWNELAALDTPRIFLTTTPGGLAESSVHYVVNDFEYAAYSTMRMLLEAGARKPLWLGGMRELSLMTEIERGIHRAMREHGLKPESMPADFCGYTHIDAEALMKRRGEFDGVVAASDQPAREILAALRERGLAYPVVCVDSSRGSSVPGVPTAVPDDAAIGRLAIEHLLKLIQKPTAKQPIQLKVKCRFVTDGDDGALP